MKKISNIIKFIKKVNKKPKVKNNDALNILINNKSDDKHILECNTDTNSIKKEINNISDEKTNMKLALYMYEKEIIKSNISIQSTNDDISLDDYEFLKKNIFSTNVIKYNDKNKEYCFSFNTCVDIKINNNIIIITYIEKNNEIKEYKTKEFIEAYKIETITPLLDTKNINTGKLNINEYIIYPAIKIHMKLKKSGWTFEKY
jgi:hypothetical protein